MTRTYLVNAEAQVLRKMKGGDSSYEDARRYLASKGIAPQGIVSILEDEGWKKSKVKGGKPVEPEKPAEPVEPEKPAEPVEPEEPALTLEEERLQKFRAKQHK